MKAHSPRKLARKYYQCAEQFLPWNCRKLVFNREIRPYWIGDTDRFWYRSKTHEGKTFFAVDAATGRRELAFDHEKLAAALSSATDEAVKANDLPFNYFEFTDDGDAIRFETRDKLHTYHLGNGNLEAADKLEASASELVSPDGRWAAFVRDHNLLVRDLSAGSEIALTEDGVMHYAYAKSPDSNTYAVTLRLMLKGRPPLPVAVWSPDSRKLLTLRLDERRVKELQLLQSVPPDGAARPALHEYRYAMPGDEHVPLAELVVIDIETRERVAAQHAPLFSTYTSPVEAQLAWWSEDATRVYFVATERAEDACRLCEMDAMTGAVREILEERNDTFIDLNLAMGSRPNVRVIGGGNEIIWFSERDGWAHLYLHDGETGALKKQITSGAFAVRDIVFVDEAARRVFFTACGREQGRDPYYRHLYRVNLDGSDLQLLTPEDADHQVSAPPANDLALRVQTLMAGSDSRPFTAFSPSGRYFVDTYSRVDWAPVSVLRSSDGELVCTLEESDVGPLLERGWRWPEPFSVKARDGETDIHGAIFLPSILDRERKYPVIDSIYPGPQSIRTPKNSFAADPGPFDAYCQAQALAELGFVVVTIDGMGTPFRSKAFHDASYGKLDEAGGLDDHIAGLRQLAERRPYMDLDRVGIFGHSGGGFASTRAILAYPGFYKVAVSSAGNHDQRGYTATWGERYLGLPSDAGDCGDGYSEQINARLAKNLEGKLLLACGDMDDNVHPALTLQVADALIKANKDFDLLVLPNRNHAFARGDGYFARRLWDYFVRHLMGAEPPSGYEIQVPGGRATPADAGAGA